MKKLNLFITVFLLCFNLQMTKAQTLYVSNTSSGDFEYKITTYMYYTKAGDLCTGNNWALPFTFYPGSILPIEDGSFEFTSPYNGYVMCLSEPLDGTCDPHPLDWYGLRIYDVGYSIQPDWWGFGGGVVKSAAVPCYFGDQDQLSYPTTATAPILDNWYTEVQGDYLALIYNHVQPYPDLVASIQYMDWVFMQTLQFN